LTIVVILRTVELRFKSYKLSLNGCKPFPYIFMMVYLLQGLCGVQTPLKTGKRQPIVANTRER